MKTKQIEEKKEMRQQKDLDKFKIKKMKNLKKNGKKLVAENEF